MFYPCVSKRHAYSDLAEAQRCCVSQERTEDKSKLLAQQEEQEQKLNTLQQATSKCAERIASHKKLLAELENNLTQAKAKRQEMLANGQIPKPDSAPVSLAADIEEVTHQIRTMNEELSSLSTQSAHAAERLSQTTRELSRIDFHAERDGLYKEMTDLIHRWNKYAARLFQIQQEAGDTTSTVVRGEYAILHPDLVRFGGSGRAALKAVGLRADVGQFMTGARGGMFL